MFQFRFGSIERAAKLIKYFYYNAFQFRFGSIESNESSLYFKEVTKFQFRFGSIESRFPKPPGILLL